MFQAYLNVIALKAQQRGLILMILNFWKRCKSKMMKTLLEFRKKTLFKSKELKKSPKAAPLYLFLSKRDHPFPSPRVEIDLLIGLDSTIQACLLTLQNPTLSADQLNLAISMSVTGTSVLVLKGSITSTSQLPSTVDL